MKDIVRRKTTYDVPVPVGIEMKTVKCYTTYGVQIYVELDRQTKTATIVEWHQGKQAWIPKEFQFAKRTAEYMNGWIAIFRACEQAIMEAKRELEQFNDDELQKMLDMHIALNKIDLERDEPANG